MNPPAPYDALARGAATLGVPLTPEQIQGFRTYTQRLLEANRRVNLTALRDEPSLITRYHLDALALIPAIARAAGLTPDQLRTQPWRLADVGSGGGAPAIPLALAWPSLHLTLIESIAKKARFLEATLHALHLSGQVLQARAEDVGQHADHREAYHLVTARAVAALPTLVELTLPLVRVGGLAVYPKGPRAQQELQDAARAIQMLGGDLVALEPVQVPGVEEPRYVVILRKRAATPARYPRRAGIPAKRSLR